MRQQAGGTRVGVLEAVVRRRGCGRGHGYYGRGQLVAGAGCPCLLLNDRDDSVGVTDGVISASFQQHTCDNVGLVLVRSSAVNMATLLRPRQVQ